MRFICHSENLGTLVTAPFTQWTKVMHLSMLSLRGGGAPQAYVGHLTSIAFLTLENLTKNLGPRVGTFGFLHGGMAPSHIVPCACLFLVP